MRKIFIFNERRERKMNNFLFKKKYIEKKNTTEYSGKGNDNGSSNSINYKIYKKYQQPRYLQLFMPAQ